MHELKTGLDADKFATFQMFRKRLSLIRFVKGPHTLYNRLYASRLAWFRKLTRKHVSQGKKAMLALFVISFKGYFYENSD